MGSAATPRVPGPGSPPGAGGQAWGHPQTPRAHGPRAAATRLAEMHSAPPCVMGQLGPAHGHEAAPGWAPGHGPRRLCGGGGTGSHTGHTAAHLHSPRPRVGHTAGRPRFLFRTSASPLQNAIFTTIDVFPLTPKMCRMGPEPRSTRPEPPPERLVRGEQRTKPATTGRAPRGGGVDRQHQARVGSAHRGCGGSCPGSCGQAPGPAGCHARAGEERPAGPARGPSSPGHVPDARMRGLAPQHLRPVTGREGTRPCRCLRPHGGLGHSPPTPGERASCLCPAHTSTST